MVPFRSLPPAASSSRKVRVARDVLRPLEHHVLEEVREAGAAGRLVHRADVVPDVHGDERQPLILGKDHLEAVGERVLLEGNRRQRRRRRFVLPASAARHERRKNDHLPPTPSPNRAAMWPPWAIS